MSGILHYVDNRLTDGGDVVSLTQQPAALSAQKHFLILIFTRD
jgi:hypothetical protein